MPDNKGKMLVLRAEGYIDFKILNFKSILSKFYCTFKVVIFEYFIYIFVVFSENLRDLILKVPRPSSLHSSKSLFYKVIISLVSFNKYSLMYIQYKRNTGFIFLCFKFDD